MSTWRQAYALDELVAEVDAQYPGRDRGSEGSIGDPAHAADPTSDHNPVDGIVHAHDFDADWLKDGDRRVGMPLAAGLLKSKDARIKYVIYKGRIFYGSDQWASFYEGAGAKAWTWYTYYGADQHLNHVHVSVVPTGSADTRSPWDIFTDWFDMATKADLQAVVHAEVQAAAQDIKEFLYYGDMTKAGKPAAGGGTHTMALSPLGQALLTAIREAKPATPAS